MQHHRFDGLWCMYAIKQLSNGEDSTGDVLYGTNWGCLGEHMGAFWGLSGDVYRIILGRQSV